MALGFPQSGRSERSADPSPPTRPAHRAAEADRPPAARLAPRHDQGQPVSARDVGRPRRAPKLPQARRPVAAGKGGGTGATTLSLSFLRTEAPRKCAGLVSYKPRVTNSLLPTKLQRRRPLRQELSPTPSPRFPCHRGPSVSDGDG